MDNKTLILCLLRGDEITYESVRFVPNGHATLNKWSYKKSSYEIPRSTFHELVDKGVIELSSANLETDEEHFQLSHRDDMLKTLNECVLNTTNSKFETIFKDILLKYKRKLKLKKINENTISR